MRGSTEEAGANASTAEKREAYARANRMAGADRMIVSSMIDCSSAGFMRSYEGSISRGGGKQHAVLTLTAVLTRYSSVCDVSLAISREG